MIQSDYHMHSDFSADCRFPMETMIRSAVEKGLRAVCFTEHNDKDYPLHPEDEGREFLFDEPEYFERTAQLREKYSGRLDIFAGVEIGLQPHLSKYYQNLTGQYPFDFVIGSMHVVDGMDPYYGEIFEGRSDRDVYERTFRQTIECIKEVSCFDVLGHIDYVVRYGREKEKEYVREYYETLTDEILRLIISSGRGIEVNTAGLKHGLSFVHPRLDILKKYRQMGGEIVTVGADAHRPEQIAYGFAAAKEALEACGFKYYTEFRERKPYFYELR